MDFVVGLPRTQRSYDSTWVVLDRLTKSARFIPVKSTYSVKDYARIFIDEILCRHIFHYPSYHIRVHNSHLGFEDYSKKGWVLR